MDLRGNAKPLADEERLYGWPRVSPDGKRIALEVGTGTGSFDTWALDVPSRTLTRLTNRFTGIRPATWSFDGRRISYLAVDSSLRRIRGAYWIRGDGGAAPESIISNPKVPMEAISVGAPHSFIAMRLREGRAADIWIAPLDTPAAARAFVATAAAEDWPRISRDGKFLAYASDETGRFEVYIRPLTGPGRVQASSGGGTDPVWHPSGRELFYRAPERMMLASLSFSPELAVTNATRCSRITTTEMLGGAHSTTCFRRAASS